MYERIIELPKASDNLLSNQNDIINNISKNLFDVCTPSNKLLIMLNVFIILNKRKPWLQWLI